MTNSTLTPQDRWNNAITEIRKNGVTIHQNVRACCPSCVDFDDATDLSIGWTFGGQGSAYQWVDGTKMVTQAASSWNRESVSAVYFNHSNGAAPVIAAAFRNHGFEVEWNGTSGHSVEVFTK